MRHDEIAATAVDEDPDTALTNGCKREAAAQPPFAYPLYRQGASAASLLHEVEKMEREQSEQTQGYCTSLQPRCRRVVWQIHEVQEACGNQDHVPAVRSVRHFPLSNIAGYHSNTTLPKAR